MFATSRRVFAAKAVIAAALPLALYGFSSGPPVGRTGAPTDGGGQNCSGCHRTFGPANSGPGRVTISAVSYTPGTKQTITVTVEDPTALRWGFQITARYRSDENVEAGAFHATDLIRVRCDPDGRAAPCGGAKEYAEHTAPATQQGTPVRGIFTVEWTAPEKDFGEVVFYAAGNAANGDGTNQNDHIYTTLKVIRAVCKAGDNPTVFAVGDAAGLGPALVPGGLVSIYGDGFLTTGNAYRAAASDLSEGRLPTDFGCVQVTIGGRSAPILSMTGGLINAQVPALTPAGNTDISVSVRSGDDMVSIAPVRARVTAVAPALFTSDGVHVAATTNGKPVTADAAAKPGDTVSLFATGCGPSTPAWDDGEFPKGQAPLVNSVGVTVAGTALADGDVLYAGAAEGQPGVCRLDIRLPATLDDGDAPVGVRIAGQPTQSGTVLSVKR